MSAVAMVVAVAKCVPKSVVKCRTRPHKKGACTVPNAVVDAVTPFKNQVMRIASVIC